MERYKRKLRIREIVTLKQAQIILDEMLGYHSLSIEVLLNNNEKRI